MGHIYVSYSRRDQEVVDRIVEAIKHAGMDVWIDREEIKASDLWRESVVKAIDDADAFLLMLSPNSVASDEVNKQVALAEDSKRALVPLMLAPVKLPPILRYQLAGIQRLEYYQDPEAKIAELVKVLREIEAKPATEPSAGQLELVINGIDPSKFGPAEQQKLLDLIAQITSAPVADLKILALVTAGSSLAGDSTTDAPPPPKKKRDK